MHHLMSNMQQIIVFVVKIRLSAKLMIPWTMWTQLGEQMSVIRSLYQNGNFPKTFRFVSIKEV